MYISNTLYYWYSNLLRMIFYCENQNETIQKFGIKSIFKPIFDLYIYF